MRLYQKPCARVNSGFEDLEGEKLEFKISHYVYENSEEENISIEYANPKSLGAGYLTFTDGHDGYWYGFYAPGNKTGNGSLYGIKISKEDYSVTDLGTQTLSSCLLVQVRRIYHTPVISNGYVYIPKYDTASSGSYYAYASSTLYKVNLTNFADIFYIKCDKCNHVLLVEADSLEYDTSVYDRAMGEEIEYNFYGEVCCEECHSWIEFNIRGYEYPIGAFNFSDCECRGESL